MKSKKVGNQKKKVGGKKKLKCRKTEKVGKEGNEKKENLKSRK